MVRMMLSWGRAGLIAGCLLLVLGSVAAAQDAAAGEAGVGPAEIGPAEIGPAEIGPAEVGPAELGPAEVGAGEGAIAWRAGDYAGAQQRWESLLQSGAELPARERARLAYNLGVAHHTADEPLRAACWFESALRLAPRWGDAKANRDLARADAGLDPKDTGIVGGFVHFFTRGESEWLALLGGLLVLLTGAIDAFRGGGWRRGPWIAILAVPILWTPLIGHILSMEAEAVMVVAEGGAALYGTPDVGGERLGQLKEGAESIVLDRLPGWVKVLDRGEERWTDQESVLSLMR